MKDVLDPPGLPEQLREPNDQPGPRSTWDLLAAAILRDTSLGFGYRCRVRWPRHALLHWCCRRPMRIAVIDYQESRAAFGWQRYDWRFAACRTCGQFKRLLW